MSYPVNEFPDQYIHELARRTACYVACNPKQLINGDAGERLLAESWSLPYIKRHSLEDMHDGVSSAWSNKVRYVDDPATVKAVDLKLTTRFPKEALVSLSPLRIASVYLNVWEKLVQQTTTQYPDLRTLILLLEKSHLSFALYEYSTNTWNAAEYEWRWSDDSDDMTTVHGFDPLSGDKMFAIHLNDSRLFVRQPIGIRQTCLMPPTESLCMQRVSAMIGFSPASVILLPREDDEPIFGKPFIWVPPTPRIKQERQPLQLCTDLLSFLAT